MAESENTSTGLESLRVYFDGRFDKLDSKIEELRTEIQAVKERTAVNAAKIEMLQHSQNVWFMVLTVALGIVGFLTTLAPMLRDMYRDKRKNRKILTEASIRSIVRDELSRIQSGASK